MFLLPRFTLQPATPPLFHLPFTPSTNQSNNDPRQHEPRQIVHWRSSRYSQVRPPSTSMTAGAPKSTDLELFPFSDFSFSFSRPFFRWLPSRYRHGLYQCKFKFLVDREGPNRGEPVLMPKLVPYSGISKQNKTAALLPGGHLDISNIIGAGGAVVAASVSSRIRALS